MRSVVDRSPEAMVAGLSTAAGATVLVVLVRRLRTTQTATIAMTTIARIRRRAIEARLRRSGEAECSEVVMVGQFDRRASVGARRAARDAGYNPAMPPMTMAATIPPTIAMGGITMCQCLIDA